VATEPEETPVLNLLATMTAASLEASDLDSQTLMLVRLGALIAVDAPPASYMLNLAAAGTAGVTSEDVQGVLAAVAPIVGTSRVVSAAGKLVRALDLKIELGELGELAE
jgi:alkylhydroperoxidase/carboxymuconolactone decarboxylase family protein YurZ